MNFSDNGPIAWDCPRKAVYAVRYWSWFRGNSARHDIDRILQQAYRNSKRDARGNCYNIVPDVFSVDADPITRQHKSIAVGNGKRKHAIEQTRRRQVVIFIKMQNRFTITARGKLAPVTQLFTQLWMIINHSVGDQGSVLAFVMYGLPAVRRVHDR